MPEAETRLVADIGGTKARFALVDQVPGAGGEPTIREHRVLRCADFPGIEATIDHYLRQVAVASPARACFAVAGPVTNDLVRMTNLPWQFSIEALRDRYRFRQLEVLNDVAALAYGTMFAPPDAIRTIKAGTALPGHPQVVVAVGTGIGVAALRREDAGWRPAPAESGHTGLSPVSALERELHRRLGDERDHVAWESVLSGSGLVRLHRLMGEIAGRRVAELKEAAIIESCRAGDPAAMQTLGQFSGMLGAFTGDAVLAAGALGGAWLGGGLLLALDPFIDRNRLTERFFLKGVMEPTLRRVPIFSLDSERWVLVGASAWLDAVVHAG